MVIPLGTGHCLFTRRHLLLVVARPAAPQAVVLLGPGAARVAAPQAVVLAPQAPRVPQEHQAVQRQGYLLGPP